MQSSLVLYILLVSTEIRSVDNSGAELTMSGGIICGIRHYHHLHHPLVIVQAARAV